jgi:hypothetical protein
MSLDRLNALNALLEHGLLILAQLFAQTVLLDPTQLL